MDTAQTPEKLPGRKTAIAEHMARHRRDAGVTRLYGQDGTENELWWDHYRAHHRGEDTPNHVHDWHRWSGIVLAEGSQVVR